VVVPTVVDLPQRRVSLAPPRLGRRVAWAVAGSCVLQPAEGKQIASFPGAPGEYELSKLVSSYRRGITERRHFCRPPTGVHQIQPYMRRGATLGCHCRSEVPNLRSACRSADEGAGAPMKGPSRRGPEDDSHHLDWGEIVE